MAEFAIAVVLVLVLVAEEVFAIVLGLSEVFVVEISWVLLSFSVQPVLNRSFAEKMPFHHSQQEPVQEEQVSLEQHSAKQG